MMDDGDLVDSVMVPVSSGEDLLWIMPLVSIDGGSTDTPRGGIVTTPPTDLELSWDPALISSGAVGIVLMALEGGDIEEITTLAMREANNGSYTVTMDTLAGIDPIYPPDDTVVFVKVGKK